MTAKKVDIKDCNALIASIVELGKNLGLETKEEYNVAKRIWGSNRSIDIILRDPKTSKVLGIECKFQKTPGTIEEKLPATIEDIKAWPMDGIVVYGGEGITVNMKSYLVSTGKALEFEELDSWLKLYFGLPLN
ncbi:MAG TPA: hypothetical protein DCZ94_21285 [Lentisphaeria bacterium]|nr:MAG: hypothetical protein A2X48_01035 [Lentisphaerae bacterium GWF2_49_21]HBC89479.1 hypothetical protein [Lentisphaeria bacterium]